MRRFLIGITAFLVIAGSVHAGDVERRSKKRCVSPSAAGAFLENSRAKSLAPASAPKIAVSGNIVVLEADPDLLILSNVFDLKDQSIFFQPAPRGRYTYTTGGSNFDGEASETLQLADDDSKELIFKYFPVTFGKQKYDRCYINSNGNITFQRPDPEPPSAESLHGIPRISGFFADLNPENQGTILVRQSAEKIAISWIKIPEFYNQDQFDYGQNTFQIVLYADGRIHLVFSGDVSATQGLVGIIPQVENLPPRMVDFSHGNTRTLSSWMENFHDYESIDIPRAMQSLYASRPDRYDFVTLLSNFDLTPVPGAQAFAINVRNNVYGIGNPSEKTKAIFRDNGKYGSAGRLQNITFLGNIHDYPEDPSKRITDLNTSLLEILGHEVGHRWLTFIKWPRDGQKTNSLLGRDLSHWSFFLNSRGSYLEGNQISERGIGAFETGAPYQRFSDLDLYLMGFLSPGEVSDTLLVEGAANFNPDFPFSEASAPEANVRFTGNAVTVRIQDIVTANGARRPKAENSQKEFRHLFVLITKKSSPATEEELSNADLLRTSWEEFFLAATGGRGKISTVVE